MIEFTKMHGLGNDFVIFDGTSRPDLTAESIVHLCDRRRGVGADGVIIVTPVGTDAIRMEYWNADGSPSEMCGNGLRCAAWYGHAKGWVQGESFLVETARGPLQAHILGERLVRVDVGEVSLGQELPVQGVVVATASVGNPHAVIDVVEVRTAPVEELGSRVGTDATFPDGTNVEFMAVTDAGIELRVWERGVGETLACGSGAAAAAAVAVAQGKATSPVTVLLPGGQLIVDLAEGRAHLTGPAEVVFAGSIALG